ncbi:Pls/PosA family non-ribosomal peptide synthetase [Arthrobacter sp. NPDC057009]|uniref:Pls/PosA family non-ribosomal peptide synthetase n=1 Tax=Arthrobacter sp. NPDC057009 TaxID=3345996 RepID=UPI00363FE7E4
MDIIRETIRTHADALAIDDGTVPLTYRELGFAIDAVAQRLRSLDIGAGDRVGVRAQSGCADLYVAILGTLASGAAYVPVDADDPDDRADVVWSEAGVCAVIGDHLEVSSRPGAAGTGSLRVPGLDDDAWIIFTSGSTGKPKGVAVSHRSAAAWADAEAGMFCSAKPLAPGDRILAGLSVAFDASCEEMWLAWRNGACLVPAPRAIVRSGEDLGPWLAQRKITAVSTVPTLAALWPADTLEHVRLLIFGGEACPSELMSRLAGPDREVWNTYGPTEATVIACGARYDGSQPVRIGLPLPGWLLAVVDDAGRPVKWGEEGELIIGGVGLGRYLDAEKDAEKFAPMPSLGWDRAYRSGDVVQADPAGLVFKGRADDQVKLAGRRVELGEVDAALSRLAGVAAAACAVQTTESGNKVLVGYLAPETSATVDLGNARLQLLDSLPAQLVPNLCVLEMLPLKASGKVDRKALPWPVPDHRADQPQHLSGTAKWLAEQWESLLGPLPLTEDSDFFALGGASVAAAQLVAMLRKHYPQVSIADVYATSALGPMARYLDGLATTVENEHRAAATPWWTGLLQYPLLLVFYGITGLKYVTGLAIISLLLFRLVGVPWVPNPPLLPVLVAWFVLFSAPSRFLVAALSARLLTLRVRPGTYPRGGLVHLRVWAAERIATYCSLGALTGTPFAAMYGRALGCKIGKDVHLDAMPPVTGMAVIETGASIEHGVDMAGHWIEGNRLHIGPIKVGSGARVGARSTLLCGADIEPGAEVDPGTCVNGRVPAHQLWSGSPMQHCGAAGDGWPVRRPSGRRSFGIHLLYPLSLVGLSVVMAVSALPGVLLLLVATQGSTGLDQAALILAAGGPVAIVAGFGLYLMLTAWVVRGLSRLLKPGFQPITGASAWAAWLTEVLLTRSRVSAYGLYASLLTPAWLRFLGARVGQRVEISTVETMPHLTTLHDRSFLADHSMVSFKRVRSGWLHLGHASVGEKSFVGNSATVGPDRNVPNHSLIAVLSSAPEEFPEGSSWFGLPPAPLSRPQDHSDSSRTYNPAPHLVAARGAVEACRILPAIIAGWLALAATYVLASLYLQAGLSMLLLLSGPVLLATGVVSCLVALVAKWMLMGRFKCSEHPLWTSFVWRNELADVFSESLAVAGLVGMSIGTPLFNLWLRCMGTKVGRRVWCETRWLPEFDLIRLEDGASVNRGCVLQTHLFHDRIMRLDEIRLGKHSSLGPNSIVLPGSSLGPGAVVGGASLVMRAETVPAHSRWAGNPLRHWTRSDDRGTDQPA